MITQTVLGFFADAISGIISGLSYAFVPANFVYSLSPLKDVVLKASPFFPVSIFNMEIAIITSWVVAEIGVRVAYWAIKSR